MSAALRPLAIAGATAGAVALVPVLDAGPVATTLAVAVVALVAGPLLRAPRRSAPFGPLLVGGASWFALGAAGLDHPLPVALVVAAVAAAGATASARRPRATRAVLPIAAAGLVLLAALPDLFGAAPGGWARIDGELGARVLDLSPATVLAEAGGTDWMRHPSVYAPAGTDWFSDARAPFDGFVVGWSAALALLLLFLLAPARLVPDARAHRTETHRPEAT